MGLIRKTASVLVLGLIDFRLDDNRIARASRMAAKEAKKQTELVELTLEERRKNRAARKESAKRRAGNAVLAVLTMVLVLVPASRSLATPKVLWESGDLKVSGALRGDRLRLTHVNLSNFPLAFECRFRTVNWRGDKEPRLTSGYLSPHEVRTKSFRRQGDLPSRTKCSATPDAGLTILWTSDTFEVLGSEVIQPDGSPNVFLDFYNMTKEQSRTNCPFWYGSILSPELILTIWSPDLAPYGWSGLSSGGVTLGSVTDVVCEPYVAGAPAPISVPDGLAVLFDSGTFIATRQSWYSADGYSRYLLRFINRLEQPVQATCTWIETWPDGTARSSTWAQGLYAFGQGGQMGGFLGSTPIAFSGILQRCSRVGRCGVKGAENWDSPRGRAFESRFVEEPDTARHDGR